MIDDKKIDEAVTRSSNSTLEIVFGLAALVLLPILPAVVPRLSNEDATAPRVLPASSLSEVWSHAVVITVGIGAWFVVAGIVIALWARDRRDAKAPLEANAPLSSGDAVLAGIVECDGETPIRFDLLCESVITPLDRDGRGPAWRDAQRRVHAVPFDLVRPSGERVRVEADERVQLIARLGKSKSVPKGDERMAVVRKGETITVRGEVVLPNEGATGYREAEVGPMIRTPDGGRLVVTAHGVLSRGERRIGVHRSQLVFGAVLFAMVNLGVLGPFYAALIWGREENVAVAPTTWTTKSKSGSLDQRHGVLASIVTGGATTRVRTQVAEYTFTRLAPDSTLPFRVLPFAPSWSFLVAPTVGRGELAMLLYALELFVVSYYFRLKKPVEWYERRLEPERAET